MTYKKKIIKTTAISISILLIFLSLNPTIYAHMNSKTASHELTTAVLGIGEKKTTTILTTNEYKSVKSILRNFETTLNSVETNQEAILHMGQTLDQLHSFGIFGDINIELLKEICTRQNRLLSDLDSINNYEHPAGIVGGNNAFCVLLSHIKGYVYDHGLLFFLAALVALSALPFIIIFYPLGAIFNFISEQIYSLQNKKPFIPPFPHQVETRYNESYSNLISRGLYGRVNNDYTNWGFRFDAFTGVRINLDRDETLRINESYYLGSALFVSWNYDGPH
jgi:hypothetical protein